MKTRIISAVILGAVTAAALLAGIFVSPFISTLYIAVIAAAAVYELTCRAAKIQAKIAWIGACIYAFFAVFIMDTAYLPAGTAAWTDLIAANWVAVLFAISAIYFVFAVIVVLRLHRSFSLAQIAVLCGLVMPFIAAFGYLDGIIKHEHCVYYILLMFDFSWFCDTGAYFVGVRFGKHKLCPKISPKKTVEGAIGGIAFSIVGVLILMFAFGMTTHLVTTPAVTVPFCIIGMLGDLFASAIKRAAGIKDYSNLIPGHGGIIDRTDSILLIVPLLYYCIEFGVV